MIPLYDVVVCTKNSGLTLDACLTALKNSGIPYGKIFIIDKHSLDGTKEIAEKHECIYIGISVGCAEARIIGAKMCESEYFINLDSDLIVPTNFYENLEPYITANFITKGIYRNVLPIKDKAIADRDHYWMLHNIGSLDCCFIHRDTFLKLSSDWVSRGLDAGEDTDLYVKCERLGLKVHQDTCVISEHHVFSVLRILKQTRWYGAGSRKGRITGRFTITRPHLLPAEMCLFPLMGFVEMFKFHSVKLFFYECAKMIFWFWGWFLG
ncbi:MAG: glycosyltransferase family 2 protein [Candidatus Hodarchaeota archaeon]